MSDYINRKDLVVTNENLQLCPCPHPKCEQARFEEYEINNVFAYSKNNYPVRLEEINNYLANLEISNATANCEVKNTTIQWEDNNPGFSFCGKPAPVFSEHPYFADFPLKLYLPRNQKFTKTYFPRRNK